MLCIAAAILWGRSTSGWEEIEGDLTHGGGIGTGEFDISLAAGELYIDISKFDVRQPLKTVRPFQRTHGTGAYNLPRGSFGFKILQHTIVDSVGRDGVRLSEGSESNWPMTPIRGTSYAIAVPLYALVLLFAILPLVWIWTWQCSRRRIKGSDCRVCGYDLRASKDRCSECGSPIQAA